MHILQRLLSGDRPCGVYSCCSANRMVVSAAAERAAAAGTLLLVEATANQVDQFGGYAGMTPAAFYSYVMKIARDAGLHDARVILGGDHLGPLRWSGLPAKEAMRHACDLVAAYAQAGFSKIHLDTSMHLGGDNPQEPLPDEVIAARSAKLCKICEDAGRSPVYVVGSEVPVPGGAYENEDSLAVTTPEAFQKTVEAFQSVFGQWGLKDAWERVIGVVVQPGVEFSEKHVFHYDSRAAQPLARMLQKYPRLVFEGHSTDYQPKDCLRSMVRDGIRILKVGPAFTFALREALFALHHIEREIPYDFKRSDFRKVLDGVMRADPKHWKGHYHGTEAELRFSRVFGFSDRTRYYLNDPVVADAQNLLIANLHRYAIPLTLLSQYLPRQYARVCEGTLANEPEALIKDKIGDCIDDYLYAVMP